MIGGFWASVAHLERHHENRDKEPGVSLDDLRGAYHGVSMRAPLLVALENDHPADLPEADRELLLEWLRGDRISEDYDNLDLGFESPAEILDAGCLGCHARGAEEGDGIGETVPLEYWDDVEKLAWSREIEATPEEILIASTHTHALSLGVVTLVLGLLLVATRWPAFVTGGLFFAGGLALLLDLSAWWLARGNDAWVFVIAAMGAAYTGSMALASLLILLDLWLPRPGSGGAGGAP